MSTQYNPHAIEPAIQTRWESEEAFKAPELETNDENTFYCLSMFPYPSGRLHMGHVRNYTLSDVIARFQRMRGKKVLHPMGWDAFGLPAENAALKNNVAPAAWTRENFTYMRNQLKRLGFGFDWSRELATCHPEYYRWEQWLFIKLYEKGIVYRKNSVVNWDPVDQTVLANEQVIDGKGWRSGAPVERREIPQWFLRITAYADELLEGLDELTEWPEQVRTMQRNWIGRSQGALVRFELAEPENAAIDLTDINQTIEVFTTRADTLMGATYLAIAAQHPLTLACAKHNPALQLFVDDCDHIKVAEADMATLEKAGIDTGLRAKHPLTGELIPVWAANFVISDYGTGAVMSVPGHDQRDWEFAKAYNLPIKAVIAPETTDENEATAPDVSEGAFLEHGRVINSGKYDGLTSQAAIEAVCADLSAKNAGETQTQYRLRDWGVSRQRYWGAPIPMIYCKDCGAVPVPEADLPVKLPQDVEFDDTGGSPLKRMREFIDTPCPKCGKPAERETDTFDTFMESSWYYARFASGNDPEKMVNPQANNWLPVDQYVGGIEHAVLHLLYARFYHRLMRDLGLVQSNEPFKRLLCQGMLVAETFYRELENGTKEYFNPEDVKVERDEKGRITSAISIEDGKNVLRGPVEKISKSKNNGVDPQILIDSYGVDTVRLFTMFAAPPEQSLEWSDSGVEGAFRFLKKLWRMAHSFLESHEAAAKNTTIDFTKVSLSTAQQDVRRKTHQTIAKAKDDIGRRYRFNTAIAAVMELTNTLQKASLETALDQAIYREGVHACVLIMAPITPHICQQLWEDLGESGLILDQLWPSVDESALTQASITLVVQVNGKLRGKINVAADGDKEAWVAQAQAESSVQKFIADGTIRKTIVVPGKLINFVVTPS